MTALQQLQVRVSRSQSCANSEAPNPVMVGMSVAKVGLGQQLAKALYQLRIVHTLAIVCITSTVCAAF